MELLMQGFTLHDKEMVIRLLLAAFLGGLIGSEREISGKEAGLRTHSLVCLGSALVMLISIEIYHTFKDVAPVDPSRIAAQVVSGIGFLGAGAILRSPHGISGLTTAASLWVVSAVGLACGSGFLKPAILTTVLMLVILMIFGYAARHLGWKDA